jgi:hypothetical protein
MYFSYKGFLFKELSFELFFIPSPTKLQRDIVTLPSVCQSIQGCYAVKIWACDLDLWHTTLKINTYQILLRTKYVPSLVKILWKMLILECSQGCYAVKILPCDLVFLDYSKNIALTSFFYYISTILDIIFSSGSQNYTLLS